jgi:hypothetical protein
MFSRKESHSISGHPDGREVFPVPTHGIVKYLDLGKLLIIKGARRIAEDKAVSGVVWEKINGMSQPKVERREYKSAVDGEKKFTVVLRGAGSDMPFQDSDGIGISDWGFVLDKGRVTFVHPAGSDRFIRTASISEPGVILSQTLPKAQYEANRTPYNAAILKAREEAGNAYWEQVAETHARLGLKAVSRPA